MPLPSPILDDRSYDQLLDELRRRIPVYTPEWTDHNASDPGITLLELFSHLGEALLFRFNQIPETTRLAFLRLLQIPLRAAEPARAMVELTTKKLEGVLVPLRTGPDGGTPTEALAGKIPFELETETYVMPVRGLAIAKHIATTSSDPAIQEAIQRALDARGELDAAKKEVPGPYTAVPLDGDPNDVTKHVDFGSTVDDTLWIAVLRAIDEPEDHAAFLKHLTKCTLNVGIYPDEQVPTMDQIDACPGTGVTSSPPGIVWQISSELRDRRLPQYRTIVPSGDTTRGLTRPGIVRLQLPDDMDRFAALKAADFDDANREGTDDLPPPIENEKEAAKVLFWLRAYRRDGGPLRRFAWVGLNAAEVVQHQTALPEFLGMGSAQPNQQVTLIHKDVVKGSVGVQVEEEGGRWKSWQEVEHFHASSDDDRHFVVDSEAGTVTFGNGVNGRAPQIGERIRTKSYRYGGGRAGNVPAKAINKLTRVAEVKISNILPARGGEDKETIDNALERIPGEFRRHDRAVAASDFRELAVQTPGAEVGRAEVLPLFHPRHRDEISPGTVSVVVWPKDDPQHPDAPLPTRSVLASVCRWLDARRLVTTELYVIPPTYRKIAVSVGIEVKPGHGIEAVRRWVELVLRQYLAPLPPYGPSGQGWPLGRRVHGPELEAAALQVEGVEFLHGLAIAVENGQHAWTQMLAEQPTITLFPWEVPQLAEITIVAQAAPPPAGQHEIPPPRRPKRLPVLEQPGATPGGPQTGAGTEPPTTETPTTAPSPTEPSPGGPAPPVPGAFDERIAIPVPIPIPKVEC